MQMDKRIQATWESFLQHLWWKHPGRCLINLVCPTTPQLNDLGMHAQKDAVLVLVARQTCKYLMTMSFTQKHVAWQWAAWNSTFWSVARLASWQTECLSCGIGLCWMSARAAEIRSYRQLVLPLHLRPPIILSWRSFHAIRWASICTLRESS